MIRCDCSGSRLAMIFTEFLMSAISAVTSFRSSPAADLSAGSSRRIVGLAVIWAEPDATGRRTDRRTWQRRKLLNRTAGTSLANLSVDRVAVRCGRLAGCSPFCSRNPEMPSWLARPHSRTRELRRKARVNVADRRTPARRRLLPAGGTLPAGVADRPAYLRRIPAAPAVEVIAHRPSRSPLLSADVASRRCSFSAGEIASFPSHRQISSRLAAIPTYRLASSPFSKACARPGCPRQ